MSTHVVCWWHASIWIPGVIWLVVGEQGLLCWVQVVRLSVSGMPVGGGWGCQERFPVETLHSCSQGQPFINCDEILFIALPQFIFLVSCPFSHIIILMPLHKQIYYCTHLINSSLYENICPLRQSSLIGQGPDTWWPYYFFAKSPPISPDSSVTSLVFQWSINKLMVS